MRIKLDFIILEVSKNKNFPDKKEGENIFSRNYIYSNDQI